MSSSNLHSAAVPLVVDLDGTLLRSDLLVETGLLFLRAQPLNAWQTVAWLARGKAYLKQELAASSRLDVSTLPYDQRVIEFIEHERLTGRMVMLATASHESLARQVADHLGLFDEVIATGAQVNLSAYRKRDALVARFGHRGFDYAGNSSDDLPVWEAARHAHVVNASTTVERRARQQGNVAKVMSARTASLTDWSSALRLHQWLKNLLVLVPLLAAHRQAEPSAWMAATLAFFCFGLCASSVYILNDLLDLPDDRHHPRKRQRSFAAGHLPLQAGLVAAPVLLIAAFGLAAALLPSPFTYTLALYYSATLAYSLWLKRQIVVDVITLAGLYTVRIVAGVAAIDARLTFWLLAFSMFMFLSLALMKRLAELRALVERTATNGDDDAQTTRVRGRGYEAGDLPIVASLGTAAGYGAVLVLALYINDPATSELYAKPAVMWLVCPLLLAWISRVWMLAHRGQMHDDPVVFALRDRISLATGAAFALVAWAAS